MPATLAPTPSESEQEWIEEYQRIEADLIAQGTPTPLLVKTTIERMGYRLPKSAPTLEEVCKEFEENPLPAYPDFYPPHCCDPE